MKVCIVGGFPRAGTRQFADILNQHPRVAIKGESFPKLLRMMSGLYRTADQIHKGRWSEESYRKQRIWSSLNCYAGLSKGSNSPYDFHKLDVAGFKCPRIELEHEELLELFSSPGDNIYFYYCVRRVEENFLSENSTFGVSVDQYIKKTSQSIKALREFYVHRDVITQVLSLDDYLSHENKGEWVADKIFSHFPELGVNSNQCIGYVGKTNNTNATVAKGKERRVSLNEDELKMLRGNSSFVKEVRWLEDTFECSLL